MRRLLLASAAFAPFAGAAAAADIETRSRVDAVTVYPDAALVTRTFDVDLPQGASALALKGLPFALDPASLRVSGTGGAAISIGAVEARVAPADTKADTGNEGRLKQLRADRAGWQVTIDALTGKQAMITNYGQASPEKLGDDKPLDIAQWNNAFDTIGNALAKVGDELRSAKARAQEIDDEIKAVEAARMRPQIKQPLRDVSIALDTAAATKATFTVAYRVTGASWRAAYDARLDTGGRTRKPGMDLVRRAEVMQNTGEDWTDVALTLSTTRALRGSGAPDVQPERLAFWEPPAPMAAPRAAASPAGRAKGLQQETLDARDSFANAPAAPVAAREQEASLDAGAYQANFVAPGKVSVPADGATKTFALATKHYDPALIVKTAPALDPTAYLETHLTNDEDAPLLAGTVSVQRDGAYVGQTRLPFVASGEAFDLGFGADDRVKVTRAPVRKKENEPTWFNQTKVDAREFKTTLKNLHDFPIKATVVDRIPFSDNTAITVELLPQTTPPTDKQVGDRRGVMAWTFDLAPQEQKDIRLAWRMKWPGDRDVVAQPAPIPR
ncbi:MAG: mucoidy inhibitor MuiA family protein [Hyphomicrobiales bacterium]|nr:mucoidy inhibitor MuiA family protein [Hyphomicrobiales bacterium]